MRISLIIDDMRILLIYNPRVLYGLPINVKNKIEIN